MIRINLIKNEVGGGGSEDGLKQLLFFGAILLGVCVLLYFPYQLKASELDKITRTNADKTAQIEKLKVQVKDVERLTKEKKRLEEQINVLEKLELGRSGPVRVLDDIQVVLSIPKNDLEAADFERRGWNSKWEPSRLWFNSMGERAGSFTLEGGGRTSDDVAEFLRRLSSSKYFYDVRILNAEQVEVKKPQFGFVAFEVSGRLQYNGQAPEPPQTKNKKIAPKKKK